MYFFFNPDSYCKYSEKSEILHELWKEPRNLAKFSLARVENTDTWKKKYNLPFAAI